MAKTKSKSVSKRATDKGTGKMTKTTHGASAVLERPEPAQSHSSNGSNGSHSAAITTPDFSVLHTLKNKTILVIGGTGFLGRVMLYYLARFVPGVKLILLIRPTHGRTGMDRLEKEVLCSPVFTTNPNDSDLADLTRKMVRVVDGDATRPNLGLTDEQLRSISSEVDAVLNTAGNVEFNPPLDLSLSANTLATREALAFAEGTKGKRYVHISTCYVADRTIYKDTAPEIPVASRIINKSGNEIQIDVDKEIDASKAKIEELRLEYDTPARMVGFKERAAKELARMGRNSEDRMVEKIAKNIRTFELREALIKAGKERAERLNRPNVYTYTKTLAELMVLSKSATVDAVIVRPSIVEAAAQYPFPGWNEGIQGSAPIIYMMHRGHKMIPSLSKNPEEREDAVLDLIPVDHVAAGTILALCALLKKKNRQVYQLAAGPIETPMTITRCLHISQTTLRDHVRTEDTGIKRWARLNLQAVTVSRDTFEKFSSPRTLKFLQELKSRTDSFEEKFPGPAAQLISRVSQNVNRFYNISMLKNKMFQEFMPFINHGFPIFHNHNANELWRELPPAERPIFVFDPKGLDYIHYFSDVHIPGVVKFVFPVLEKRFQSVLKAGVKEDEEKPRAMELLRAVFSSESDFKGRLNLARDMIATTFAPAVKTANDRKTQAGNVLEPDSKDAYQGPLYTKHSAEFGTGALKDWKPADLNHFLDHILLMTGVAITPDEALELRTLGRLESRIKKEIEERPVKTKPFQVNLPKDGLNLPDWVADPTRGFLYKIQMWFYRRVLAVNIKGQKNVPVSNRKVIVVANHSSHLDYGLVQFSLGRLGRDMGILAARDYFYNNFWKSTFFTHLMTTIPIDREAGSYAESMKVALEFIKKGEPLLIFPEGTRSDDGVIQPFKHGLGYLVDHTKADVLPIRLTGTNKALPKGKTLIRGRKVRVEIGKLIPYASLEKETEGLSPTRTYDVIAKQIEKAVRIIEI